MKRFTTAKNSFLCFIACVYIPQVLGQILGSDGFWDYRSMDFM
jgi:hypothetical protein